MSLPEHAKDIKKYEEYFFFRKCSKCDCKRKHVLYVNSYYYERFREDDCDGHTDTCYAEEIMSSCKTCLSRHYECTFERFTDDVLNSIKKSNKESYI